MRLAQSGAARILDERPGRIDVEVSARARQLLVLSESYHEGWKAVDGERELEVSRADGDFLGCVVEPGRQTISFRFQPASFIWGRRMSLAGLAVWAGVLALGLA